ncbi:MAG: hypothetical protein ABIF17_03805 [Patescibacteria group bacterium]
MPKKTDKKQENFTLPEKPYKKIAVTFIVLTVILTLIVVYFSLSKAEIAIIPSEMLETKEFSIKIPINNSTTTPALLTAQSSTQELEFIESFDVENFKTENGIAQGEIIITNKNNSQQVLIATTRFLSPDGMLFRLKNQVVIPANSEITSEIYADAPGPKYDIAPAPFSIPGLNENLQKKIYGTTKTPMTGGLKKIGTLTAQEITKAQQKMINQLDKTILEKLNIHENNEQITLIKKEILEDNLSNKEGDEVEKFTISLKIKVDVIEINKEKLIAWVKEQYRQELTQDNEIINYDLDKFSYTLEDTASTYVDLKTSLPAYILGTLDLDNFNKKKLYGMDEKALETFFNQYPNIDHIEVNFWPFWVRTAPSMSDHIKLKIK